ncbi:hypothetical protein BDW59DRAFT_170405 [Aspergillus cavernicola]|uniref:tRNA (guanine(37)-N1)-methyltransferase n=1 Tax=Aspergillus cavernicola TaxID=176166 RepID=A0ABR4IPS6_9EURO
MHENNGVPDAVPLQDGRDLGYTQILTGKQEHYLKRELIARQVQQEIAELNSPTALRRFGAPFKSEFGEVAPIDSELPILRYIFVHHVRNFPFLDQAREQEFWQDKLQVFLESFANKNVSSSEDRLEETKRRKLARKCEKLVELMMVSGIPTASGYEERIQFSEMEVVDRGANEKGLLVNMPEGNAIHGWDINVAAVRVTSIRRTVRHHQHAEFIIRVRRNGQQDIFVARRFGEFAKLLKTLRTEIPGKPLPPLPRKNKSSSTSTIWGGTVEDDESSISSISTQDVSLADETRTSRNLAPSNIVQRARSRSRSSMRKASADIPRETVLFREEQRVSLRAFLRTLLQNKRAADSKAMEEFLTSDPFIPGKEEASDMERRKEVDSVRIEEQKRFYEIAQQRAAELDVYMEKFRRDIVESNGLTKLFAEIREKPTVEDLSPQYQKFAEWLRIEVAATLYHLFLAEDNSAELFAQAKRIHSLVPYTLLKNVIRIANPAAVMTGVLDLFLAQPFGSRSLLQRIFSMTLHDGIKGFQKSIDAMAAKVDDTIVAQKLKAFTDADELVKDEIRLEAAEDDVDVVVAILRSDYLPFDLSTEQVGKVFNSYVAWIHAVEQVDEEMQEGADWFANVKQLLKLYTRQRDKAMMLSIIEEPVTLQLFRDLFTIFYEPLVRVYKSANVYNSITDFAKFADDAIAVIEKCQNQGISADPNETVQAFIDLCERHQASLYKFVHEVHLHDNGLFGSLMTWIENILDFLRNGPSGGKLDMNAMFRGAKDVGQINQDLASEEINTLIKWHEDRKQWHLDKTRQKMAAEGTASSPFKTKFKGSDFGLDEADLEHLAISDADSDASNDLDAEDEAEEVDPIAVERRRRNRKQDHLRRTAGEPVKPEVQEILKLSDSFGVLLRQAPSPSIPSHRRPIARTTPREYLEMQLSRAPAGLETADEESWFYTCQKDHQHRCKFFLWASDAESREKLALLSISRSEGGGVEVTPRTPSPKTAAAQDTGAGTGTGLLTPQTGRRDITTNTHSESRFRKTPAQSHQRRTPQSTKAYMMAEDTEEFEWDDTVESEMEKLVDNSSQPLRQPDFGFGARKTLRTETFTSPGKRKRSDDDAGFDDGRSVTVTPGPEPGAMRSPPFLTPTPTKYKNAAAGVGESPLASSDDTAGQVSSILEGHGVVVPRAAQEELRELFSRHEMKMKGVIRGRDISRVSLRKKDEQIASLSTSMETTTSRDTKDPLRSDLPPMFRPPINRAMRVLDRSFFKRTIPLSAATVFKASDISSVRSKLLKSQDAINLPRFNLIREVKKDDVVRKCLLLREGIKHDDTTTWSPTISELVGGGVVGVGPYELTLDYDYWSYADIITSILPEDILDEVPQGYTQVGHVAHLNLREQYIPYRHIIAQIILDKNPIIRTVIRKTEDVGTHSEFRTFPFELLAGHPDMNVIQHEQDCEFRFDYARVYWNSRLETEHRRLVDKFRPGEMVCDVMAGVGPFAVPAGKKKIFVWANDLNPHGYEVMQDAVKRNKVHKFVTPFNQDGREFIPWSAKALLQNKPATVSIYPKARRINKPDSGKKQAKQPPHSPPEVYERPQVFDHYVMNLPGTSIEFLDAFNGVYAGHEELFTPHTSKALPMVHVYCFSGHSEHEIDDHIDICTRMSERLGHTITVEDRIGGSGNTELELAIHNVRLVSPNKQMFCVSFRIPREVAFRKNYQLNPTKTTMSVTLPPPTHRQRALPQGELEAASTLKLGADQNTHTLSLSEARLVINKVLENKRRGGKKYEEPENLTKTLDYLEVFARFKDEENIKAVERLLNSHTELEMFERSQLGSLCCDNAEEAKSLIPSLQHKISDGELQELLDELTKLRNFAE